MARCTQTDFLPSNYASRKVTAERPLTMFLADQIIVAKLDQIFLTIPGWPKLWLELGWVLKVWNMVKFGGLGPKSG